MGDPDEAADMDERGEADESEPVLMWASESFMAGGRALAEGRGLSGVSASSRWMGESDGVVRAKARGPSKLGRESIRGVRVQERG